MHFIIHRKLFPGPLAEENAVTAVPKFKVVRQDPPIVGNACHVKMGNTTYAREIVLYDHVLQVLTCTCPYAHISTCTCTKTCTLHHKVTSAL